MGDEIDSAGVEAIFVSTQTESLSSKRITKPSWEKWRSCVSTSRIPSCFMVFMVFICGEDLNRSQMGVELPDSLIPVISAVE